MKGFGIHIEGLRKRYGEGDTAVDALKDVNMTVAPGEVVGLIGPSGSGKSTTGLALLRLIASQGHILFDGMPLHSLITRRLSSTAHPVATI